ncbi:MAG: hypothetical protein ABI557_13205 [Aureliella sp.]
MPRSPSEILSQEFLQTRAKILEVAAFYDRLGQVPDSADQQRQLDLLNSACAILTDDQPDKAERVQLLLSRRFNPGWRDEFGI